MAEHSAVNRRVVGSSPTCGANSYKRQRSPIHRALPSTSNKISTPQSFKPCFSGLSLACVLDCLEKFIGLYAVYRE